MLTLSSISLTRTAQLEKYNAMVRENTYRWTKNTTSKVGELFGFYFYSKFIRIHEIIEANDVLVLTHQIIEISWDEWVKLNGPKVTKTKQYDLIHYPLLKSKLYQLKSIDKYFKKVNFETTYLEIPCAKIIKKLINNLNKEVDYEKTLWELIYCDCDFGNIYSIWKNREKLLLNIGFYRNNCKLYKPLYDFREIAIQYNKWCPYIKEKFEIDNGKITKYNGIKKDYHFLDSKEILWNYYEKSKSKSNLD